MSCFACARSYGFFCKESGCPNCGMSFCTKCLKKVAAVPRHNGAKMKVCMKCFERLENHSSANTPNNHSEVACGTIDSPLPPDLGPVLEPFSQAAKAKDVDIDANLDKLIAKRIDALRRDSDDLNLFATDEELALKLSNLKGVPAESSNKNILLSTDTRTESAQVNDLIKQFVEETTIDEQTASSGAAAGGTIEDIERRLAALRDGRVSTLPVNAPEEDVTEDQAADAIVKKFMEEVALPEVPFDEETEFLQSVAKSNNPDQEELPWCVICNEDAVLRCKECSDDLYCRQCFRECHDDEDFANHTTTAYKKPPQKEDDS